jgi:hypothetical protein
VIVHTEIHVTPPHVVADPHPQDVPAVQNVHLEMTWAPSPQPGQNCMLADDDDLVPNVGPQGSFVSLDDDFEGWTRCAPPPPHGAAQRSRKIHSSWETRSQGGRTVARPDEHTVSGVQGVVQKQARPICRGNLPRGGVEAQEEALYILNKVVVQ